MNKKSINLIGFTVMLLVLCNTNLFSDVIFLPDSSKYSGPIVNGLFSGFGTLTWRNGDYFEGYFYNGLKNGQGRLVTISYTYEGNFKDGLFHGRGRYTFFSGCYYEGDFKEGRFHGEGKMVFADGGYYIGEFKNDFMHGHGRMRMANGDRYIGEFRYSMFEGFGTYFFYPGIFTFGSRYEGYFSRGRFHGQGRYTRGVTRIEGEFRYGSFPAVNNSPDYFLWFQLIFFIIAVISIIFNAIFFIKWLIARKLKTI